jgi:hypothetical protein
MRFTSWKFQAPVAIELFEWVVCPVLVKLDLGYNWETQGSSANLLLYLFCQRLALNARGVLNQGVDVTGPGYRSQYLSVNVSAVNTLIIRISIEDHERYDQ